MPVMHDHVWGRVVPQQNWLNPSHEDWSLNLFRSWFARASKCKKKARLCCGNRSKCLAIRPACLFPRCPPPQYGIWPCKTYAICLSVC
eukprot:4097566-Amphidinium_carterae.1